MVIYIKPDPDNSLMYPIKHPLIPDLQFPQYITVKIYPATLENPPH